MRFIQAEEFILRLYKSIELLIKIKFHYQLALENVQMPGIFLINYE